MGQTQSSEQGETTLADEQFRAITRALGDPRRFAIFEQIAQCGEVMCGELNAQCEVSAATISHHLHDLEEAGLIGMRREGRAMRLWAERAVWQAYLRRLAAI